eukprot:CAMPEP_0170536550 /NCGR_PEP_ID=MMETSP0209-20121228/102199_1 /TAXON_ID=665100 ORGANISM="Litonotus pictus, Strain P1" /NCGR_SAMPLE_ID=MMETSP0209 /ASSEMBLY_ACC=CAM_ASM_000301 /LENGTH=1117 /DNA_ID=CAMNT_0010837923 /DNA_START=25 /DNA_END=3377 /DNA_ORIENTATION=-
MSMFRSKKKEEPSQSDPDSQPTNTSKNPVTQEVKQENPELNINKSQASTEAPTQVPPESEGQQSQESKQEKKFSFIKKGKTNPVVSIPVSGDTNTANTNEVNNNKSSYYIQPGGESKETEPVKNPSSKPKGFGFIKNKGSTVNNPPPKEKTSSEGVSVVNINQDYSNTETTPKVDIENLFNTLGDMNYNNPSTTSNPSNNDTNKSNSPDPQPIKDGIHTDTQARLDSNAVSSSVINSDVISYTSTEKTNPINQQASYSIKNNNNNQDPEQPKKFGFIKKKNNPKSNNASSVIDDKDQVSTTSDKKSGFLKAANTKTSEIDNSAKENIDINAENRDDDNSKSQSNSIYDAEKTLISNLTPVVNSNTDNQTQNKFAFMKKKEQDKKDDNKLNQGSFSNSQRKDSEFIKNNGKEEVIKSQGLLQEVYVLIFSIKKKISKVHSQLISFKEMFDRLTKEEEEAIEKEDYTLAGEIEEELTSKKALEEELKVQFKALNDELVQLRETPSGSIVLIFSIKKKISKVHSQLISFKEMFDRLTKEEEEAIEKEDYTLAGEIEEELTSKKALEEELKVQFKALNDELVQLRERELMSYSLSLKAYSDVKDSFFKLKDSMNKELEDFKTKDVSKHKNDQFKIKKMKEKLENMSQNLDIDKENLRAEEDKIDSLIKSQSIDVFNELDNLNKKKKETMNEIEELKRLLDEKYAFVDGLNIHIESKENEIDAIKSNFKPEFKKLNTKRNNVKEAQGDFEDQTKELESMEVQYKRNEEHNNDKHARIEKKIEDYSSEVNKYQEITEKVDSEIKRMKENLSKENELKSKLHLMEMDYQQGLSLIENTKNDIVLLEMNNKKLESDIIGLDLKVPALEEEKVKYVTAKNFKEAGRVSSELKKITESKNNLNSSIEQNHVKINQLSSSKQSSVENIAKVFKDIEECKVSLQCVNYEGLLMLKDCYTENMKNTDILENSHQGVSEETLDSLIVNREIEELELLPFIQKEYVQKKLEKERLLRERKLSEQIEAEKEAERLRKEAEELEKSKKEEERTEEDVILKNEEVTTVEENKEEEEQAKVEENDIEARKDEEPSGPSAEEINEYTESKSSLDKLNEELSNSVLNEDFDLADQIQT